jgi:predicted RND superfamily exporter protein
VSIAPTLEELRRRRDAFDALPVVYSVRSIDDLVPQDQERKREILATFAPLLDEVDPLALPEPLNVERLRKTLGRIELKLSRGEDEEKWEPGRKPDPESLEEATALLGTIRALMEDDDTEQTQKNLDVFQKRFVADFGDKLDFLRRSLSPKTLTIDDIPTTIRDGFVSKSGRYLVQMFARDDIWEPEPRRTFIRDLRQVDPDVTGGVVIAHEITEVMKAGYLRAAVWSFVVIFVLVLADFRRIRETLLAMLPLGIGAAWTLGVMALFDINFNLANLFSVPIIIGMGVDNGVNMLYRFREEGPGQPLLSTAVGKSVTLCSLTTIAGFGALMFARHQGIASLGLLLTAGVTAIFIATVVVLPAALAWVGPATLERKPSRRRRRSTGLAASGRAQPVEAQSSRAERTSL